MSTTVTNIAERRAAQIETGSYAGKKYTDELGHRADRRREGIIPSKPVPLPAEALEASLDAYRATMLELAHKRQAFEMQMTLELNTAQIKLEAAAYKAMLTGVPESDIYALGEDMAEALTSAMDTVAGA